MNESEILLQLERSVGSDFYIDTVCGRGAVPDGLQIQLTWGGTEGVLYLEVWLIPERAAFSKEIRVRTFSPDQFRQDVRCAVNVTGLFRVRIRAVLKNGTMVDTEIAGSRTVVLGKIEPIRYTVVSRLDGWQKISIAGRSKSMFAGMLYVLYDGCRYPYPQDNGELVDVCMIPSRGKIGLEVADRRFPQPEYDE